MDHKDSFSNALEETYSAFGESFSGVGLHYKDKDPQVVKVAQARGRKVKPSNRSAADIAADLEADYQRRKAYQKKKRSQRNKFARERDALMLTMLKGGQPYQCANCQSKENIQVDHITPMSKGGSDCVENLQFLCAACNQSKRDKIIEKPEIPGKQISLF